MQQTVFMFKWHGFSLWHKNTNAKEATHTELVRGTCTVSQITTAVTWPKPAEVRGHLRLAPLNAICAKTPCMLSTSQSCHGDLVLFPVCNPALWIPFTTAR